MINQLEARTYDLIKKSEKTNSVVLSSFLNEEEQFLVSKMSKDVCFFGGYEGALRKKAAFGSDFNNVDYDIICLVAEVKYNYGKEISHRDILGSLMSLNIDRNRFGDCFYQDNKIVVYVDSSVAEYVKNNCTSISRLTVEFKEELPVTQIHNFSYFNINVQSLRIDAVVSELVPCSRSKSVEYIASKKVVCNYKIVEETSRLCNNGDTISIKGIGKFKIHNTIRTTRKGRLVVEIAKFE